MSQPCSRDVAIYLRVNPVHSFHVENYYVVQQIPIYILASINYEIIINGSCCMSISSLRQFPS